MSTFPQIVAGMGLTSALLQSMLPQAARKSADQAFAGTVGTLANDSALAVPLAASATYFFQLELLYKGGTNNISDLKAGWTVPSGTTMAYRMGFADVSLIARWGFGTQSTTQVMGTNGASSPLAASVAGTVVTSSTAGNLQLQWCQNTSNGTATTVMAGSILLARRIA